MDRRRDQKAASLSSSYGEPGPLNLRPKVFLSHSGRDKEFVRILHHELRQRYVDGTSLFFDETSLPKAEPISMENILMEVKGCELGVLVLSEDFFMHTQNPMLELEALIANRVRLLPLFYKIGVDAIKKMRSSNALEKRWEEWRIVDEERIERWRRAIHLVTVYSGLELSKLATNELDYILCIVKEVTRLVRPVQFSEEGLFGMDRLCKIVDHLYKIECASERSTHRCMPDSKQAAISLYTRAGHVGDSDYTLDLVGIYGFAGLGKSTLCNCLCDFYSADFDGKVCWIDLGRSTIASPNSSQIYSFDAFRNRVQHILRMLRGSNIDDVHDLTFSQVKNMLRKQISSGNHIFLAIDNVLPEEDSYQEVKFYLNCSFPKRSKIFITARSRRTLECAIGRDPKFSVVIQHIPGLELEEAMNIFLSHVSELKTLNDVEDEVGECVNMCVLDGTRYHPLMLKSLAGSIQRDGRRSGGVGWKRKLSEVLTAARGHVDENDKLQMVFRLLDISYAVFREDVQKVFLDLSLFYRISQNISQITEGSVRAWIRSVHSPLLNDQEIRKILVSLDELSFIRWREDVYFEMHDLILEFSMFKLSQGSANLVLENSADWYRNPALIRFLHSSSSSSPKKCRTVSIVGCRAAGSSDEGTLDLRDCEGVEVLHLVNNPGVQEVLLSNTTLTHLRSFIVVVSPDDCGRTSLRCPINDEGWPTSSTGATRRPGEQLVWLEITGNVIFTTHANQRSWLFENLLSRSFQSVLQRRPSENLAGISGFGSWPFCRDLQKLKLSHFPAQQRIDVTRCTSLRDLSLQYMPGLTDVHGLEKLKNLVKLALSDLSAQKIDVTSCTGLRDLYLNSMSGLTDVHGLGKIPNLQRLIISGCNKLLVLHIPVNVSSWIFIGHCQSLKRISLCTSSCTEDRDTWTWPNITIWGCKALRNVDGPRAATSKRDDQRNRRQAPN